MKAFPRAAVVVLGVCCLTSSVTATGQQPGSPTSQASPYRSPRYGFTMEIPTGWVFQERPQPQEKKEKRGPSFGTDIVLIATEQSRGSTGAFNVNMTVAVRDIPEVRQLSGPHEITEFAAHVLESVSSSREAGAVKTFQQKGLVGAQREFRYVQSYEDKEVPLSTTVTALVSIRRGRCFLITATAPAESSAQYQALFRDSVTSFGELE